MKDKVTTLDANYPEQLTAQRGIRSQGEETVESKRWNGREEECVCIYMYMF